MDVQGTASSFPETTRATPTPVPTLPRLSRQSVQSCYAHPRDTRWDGLDLDLVRKSHILFNGETDPGRFWSIFPPDKMLSVLPEMLTDKALKWFRSNRALWYPWDESSTQPCGCPQVPPPRPQPLSNVGDVEKLRNS